MTPYFFFFTGFSAEVAPVVAPSATPYPTQERRRKKVWTVRTPWGRREEYDTAQAAYARYAELFEGAKPKAAKGKAKAKPRTAPVVAPAVEYEGVDLGAAFARLARDYGAAIGAQVANQIAAQLAAIEARARREAEERDDEEAILLLLH